jgi:signal transduction histidine kinase
MGEFLSAVSRNLSELWITAASFSIAFSLGYVIVKRLEMRFRSLLFLFAGLILVSGTAQLLHSWHDTVLRAIAAAVSAVTAIIAIRLAAHLAPTEPPPQDPNLKPGFLATKDQLQSCFEAASQGILGITSDGRISIVNHRTEEVFGYSREETLGQELGMLLPDRFAGLDLVGRRKDGTEFPIEIGLSHMNTREGPLTFGLVSDISERKKAADQLQRVNEELRQSYVEIEQLAHVASHDLQEPLRMVTNYLQLIERRYAPSLDDDGREFIRFAVDGAKRMKALISDLFEFSRAGANAANYRTVAGDSILQNALDNLKPAIEESGAQITADPLPPLVVDPVLLIQVFQNLIVNAIKFRKEGAPSIHISARRDANDWVFSVRDNGIGMEARHLERIFRIFERLHTAEQYPGSGIGLAITKKVVERHGGKIWVESQLGEGSTFFFSLSAETVITDQRTKLSFSATS